MNGNIWKDIDGVKYIPSEPLLEYKGFRFNADEIANVSLADLAPSGNANEYALGYVQENIGKWLTDYLDEWLSEMLIYVDAMQHYAPKWFERLRRELQEERQKENGGIVPTPLDEEVIDHYANVCFEAKRFIRG